VIKDVENVKAKRNLLGVWRIWVRVSRDRYAECSYSEGLLSLTRSFGGTLTLTVLDAIGVPAHYRSKNWMVWICLPQCLPQRSH
jgi:chitinase